MTKAEKIEDWQAMTHAHDDADEDIHKVDTVPPPDGKDAYSAETTVRYIPASVLEAIKKRKSAKAAVASAERISVSRMMVEAEAADEADMDKAVNALAQAAPTVDDIPKSSPVDSLLAEFSVEPKSAPVGARSAPPLEPSAPGVGIKMVPTPAPDSGVGVSGSAVVAKDTAPSGSPPAALAAPSSFRQRFAERVAVAAVLLSLATLAALTVMFMFSMLQG